MRSRRQFVRIILGFFGTLITIKYFRTVIEMDPFKKVELGNTGVTVPRLGIGTARLS